MLTALLLAVAQAPPPPAAAPRGALVVHLVDPEGELVLEDFVIHATVHRTAAAGGLWSHASRTIDRQDGSATFDGLSPGRYVVEATHRCGDSVAPVEVEVRARERVSCELRLATPPPSRCLYVVVDDSDGIEGLQLVARSASGESVPLAPSEGALQRYVARDVPPGRYTVSVVDPRFRAKSIEGVRTGELAQLTLSGSAMLNLSFRAMPDDTPVRPHALALYFTNWAAKSWRVQQDTSSVLVEDLPPGDLLAVAHFAERAPVRVQVSGLRHGERRELAVDVPAGITLTGRVVDPSGEPLADVVVVTRSTTGSNGYFVPDHCLWLGPGSSGELRREDMQSFDDARATRRVARTDAAGRYTLGGLAPGVHLVHAYGTPFTRTELELRIDVQHETHTAPDLALGGTAGADIDVRLPAELDTKDLSFVLQIGRGSRLQPIDTDASPLLDARGCLVLRGLPEKHCTLVVTRMVELDAKSRQQLTLARLSFLPRKGLPTPVVLEVREQ